ncbi:MAG: hypothetical protein AB1817_07680 [Chloroflexota bacterium]
MFSIKAIHRVSGRCSQINNLTAILSAFGIQDGARLVEEPDWTLTDRKLKQFQNMTAKIFQDQSALERIEAALQEDRMVGEWENTHRFWNIENWVSRVRRNETNEWPK